MTLAQVTHMVSGSRVRTYNAAGHNILLFLKVSWVLSEESLRHRWKS